MDVKDLKEYIYANEYIEQILTSIGCHHIKRRDGFYQCANTDGDNRTAICVYNNESLITINYTRKMIKASRTTDLIDLVCYTKNISFFEGLKYICDEIGLSYYHDFDEDIPESLRVIKLIEEMDTNFDADNNESKIVPISENILSYYKPYKNYLFYNDNISWETQEEFEIGYDEFSNRYTIPIRSELGDLIGVKGRYFWNEVPKNENKYLYLEPCAKSKVIYGLHKTMPYIKANNRIYVGESEKFVLQLWSYGFKNCGSIGGKCVSQWQIEMLVRLGIEIVFCFDKDVTKTEIEQIADDFPDGVPLWYIYDEENILADKESPSDSPEKWAELVRNNLYRLR